MKGLYNQDVGRRRNPTEAEIDRAGVRVSEERLLNPAGKRIKYNPEALRRRAPNRQPA